MRIEVRVAKRDQMRPEAFFGQGSRFGDRVALNRVKTAFDQVLQGPVRDREIDALGIYAVHLE